MRSLVSGADGLDEPAGDHLPAAFRVIGAAQEMVRQPGLHHHRRVRGANRVAALFAEQHRDRARGETMLGEELGHRPQTPLKKDRRLAREFAHAELTALEPVARCADLLHHVENRREGLLLDGEGLREPRPVAVPAKGDAKREIRKMEVRVAIGIERPKDHPLGQAQPVQDGWDHTITPTLADVVDADIEFVLQVVVLTPEDLGVSAGDVVRLEHQRAPTRDTQIGRGSQATQARADYDRVEILTLASTRPRHAIFSPARGAAPD
jgi:hypothetical protein